MLTSVRISRFWWSLLVGVDWWDAVGCTQSAAEDGIGKEVQIIKSCYYFLFTWSLCQGNLKKGTILFHICTLLESICITCY